MEDRKVISRFYHMEMKCSECGYHQQVMAGPEIGVQEESGDTIYNTAHHVKVPLKFILFFCAKEKSLVQLKHRYGNIKRDGEDVCPACKERFTSVRQFETENPLVKHLWGANHLELDYLKIIELTDSDTKLLPIPCPKCKEQTLYFEKLTWETHSSEEE